MAPSFFSKLVKPNSTVSDRSKGHSKASSQDLSHSQSASTSSSLVSSSASPRPAPKVLLTTDSHPSSPVPLSAASAPPDNSFASVTDRSDPHAKRISASNSPRTRKLSELGKGADSQSMAPAQDVDNRSTNKGLGIQSGNGRSAIRNGSVRHDEGGRGGRDNAADELGVLRRTDMHEAGTLTSTNDVHPIVESPTSDTHIVNVLIQNAYVNSAAPAGLPATTMEASAPATATDLDCVSVGSGSSTNQHPAAIVVSESPSRVNGGGSGKKKGWRRASLRSRKGSTGASNLASALAASGLAMANHGMRMSPPPMPPMPGSAGSTMQTSVSRTDTNPYTRSSPKGSPSASNLSYYQNIHGSTSHNGEQDEGDEFYSNSEDSDDTPDELDDDIAAMPVTGFAVASMKRNADFHELFPDVPESDYLIEDYGCALQRDILVQGRFYIAENHLAFHANIFGWITNLIIPVHEIISIEKKMTAFVIPNAIQITTGSAKYTFASFLSRDTTYEVVHNIWRLARPEGADSVSFGSDPRVSLDDSARSLDGATADHSVAGALSATTTSPIRSATWSTGPPKPHKATQCTCGKEGKHYSDTAMDITLPGTPETIYGLMFASGFIKDFMSHDQKLIDLQISDWYREEVSGQLARTMSYTKPLSGSLGPKQTKCELRDETVNCDFDDYVSTITTTRTPDVPSGSVFAVKTRTCLTWAGHSTTRIVVTTQVEWTGRSFIKSIIERSCLDGQKTYHADLDRAMRTYIAAHRTEFIPEGVEVVAIEVVPEAPRPETPGAVAVINDKSVSSEEESKRREHERNQRGLQWAWDTAMGAWKVAKESTAGALDLVGDAWEQSSATPILYFVIVVLILSNLWTLMMVGRREEVGRRKEMKKIEEREKWVQSIVTGLWEELAAGRGPLYAAGEASLASGPGISVGLQSPNLGPIPVPTAIYISGDWKHETDDIHQALDEIEERVTRLRKTLQDLD